MSSVEHPAVAVIVPTYNERGNVVPLVRGLEAALRSRVWRVIFADDSSDGTAAEIRELVARDDRIHLNHSPNRRGLARAVVAVLENVREPEVLVLDGDLQHPPSEAPRLLGELAAGADVAVASRYAPGGHEVGLDGPLRRLASMAATRLARAGLAPARRTTDPLSGFFAFRRSVVDGIVLRPSGFKILLEILVRGRASWVADVPYTFDRRTRAQSKVSAREGLAFLWHLGRLMGSRR